jgi:F-type H+-transporting ATPase subunit delta
MAELATLARPYAEAVFKLARESGDFARWSETLAFLESVTQDPQFIEIAANPKVSKETLRNLLLDIGGETLDEAGKNLLRLLVENRRLPVIASLRRQYSALRAEHEGVIKVELISTYAVKPQQKDEVAAALQQRFGKKVDVDVTVERKLLGGWIIRAGDQVIDMSVRGRLQQLASELRY